MGRDNVSSLSGTLFHLTSATGHRAAPGPSGQTSHFTGIGAHSSLQSLWDTLEPAIKVESSGTPMRSMPVLPHTCSSFLSRGLSRSSLPSRSLFPPPGMCTPSLSHNLTCNHHLPAAASLPGPRHPQAARSCGGCAHCSSAMGSLSLICHVQNGRQD